MTVPSLADRIAQLSAGLQYPSESDFPFEPLSWGSEEPTPDHALEALGLPRETSVEVVTVSEFFEPLMDESAGMSHDEAARYRALAGIFETELSSSRVLRIGATDIDIYVLGQDPDGTWLGLKTHAVET